ncbi:MAG: type II secretion system minor pseudopilin GspK [Pseudomonadales bacterium]|nr:type II secretion system minor pseudopilin GspK [Pseudomonadales bacterium]
MKRQRASKPRQKGVALITVLLIFAVASVIAIQMSSRLQLDLRRTENMLALDKGAAYARGAEDYAMALVPDLIKDNPQAVTLASQNLPPYIVEEGVLQVSIYELSGRFNINWLDSVNNDPDEPSIDAFERFVVELGVDAAQARDLAIAIADWIDADDDPTGVAGAESQEYLRYEPPYRTGNQPFQSVSELLLVRGMTGELYETLKPFICVLPSSSKLNINAASTPVILSLSDKVTTDNAQQLITDREAQALSAIPKYLGLDKDPVVGNVIFSPEYFLLSTEADILGRKSKLSSIVYLPPAGSTKKPVVLSRNQSIF